MSVYEQLGVQPPGTLVVNKLLNAARRSVTLLVEAGFDQRFWRMHTHPECRVEEQGQGGRPAALKKLDEAKKHPDAMLLAVLDADLDRIVGLLQSRPDVIWTDAHDLETTILGLPVLEKLLEHRVPPEKRGAREATWKETVRERLFRHAIAMGRVRWHIQNGKLEIRLSKPGKGKDKGALLRFDGYGECVNADWEPSVEKIWRALIAYNNRQALLPELPRLVLATEALPEVAAPQVCNGHDLLGFLSDLLSSQFKAANIHVDDLADAAALACERVWLEDTAMWRSILAWEGQHKGFHVLRGPVSGGRP